MPSTPTELREEADVAEGGEYPEDACRWAITMRDAADEIERLGITLTLLIEAIDQLLDDMGTDGLCVCEDAKQQAKAALAQTTMRPSL